MFGSATLLAFLIQVVSGIALATVYVPSSGEAFNALQYITQEAPWGNVVRGIHYFGASAMVFFVAVHMIRVYLTAAYKFPREMNWVSGVVLFGLTIVMGFTGQLMRWDQNAVWSAVVGAEQAARVPLIGEWLVNVFLSGSNIGTATLSHFFVLHVFVVPGLVIAIVGFHLYLVLRHGISEPPVAGHPVDPQNYRQSYEDMLHRIGVPFWPHAAWRDAVFGVVVLAVVVLLAAWVGPPLLDHPPDPSNIVANPRPDWYMLPYFALLAYLPHHAENYVIVLAPLLGSLILFAVPFISNRGERSWKRRPWAVPIVIFAVSCLGVLGWKGTYAPWSPDFNAKPIHDKIIGATDGPVHAGGVVFNTKGCLFCHTISGHGGQRGPDLTDVGDRLTRDQLVIRIMNGGYNMPAYSNNLTPEQLDSVVAFLQSRKED